LISLGANDLRGRHGFFLAFFLLPPTISLTARRFGNKLSKGGGDFRFPRLHKAGSRADTL
jgi:hypothetical protein